MKVEPMTYDAFKVVHLFGVVLFLGNIIVTAVWKLLADRTGEPRVIALRSGNGQYVRPRRARRVRPIIPPPSPSAAAARTG